jgi:transcriptional regulator with XRE-family HTH domain
MNLTYYNRERKMNKEQTSENLRYLLWRERVSVGNWPRHLAGWAGCNQERAEELLRGTGEPLQDAEQEAIKKSLGVNPEEIQYTRLLESDRVNILVENVVYLLDSLEHGEQKQVADKIGRSPLTVSRWHTRKQPPELSVVKQLQEALGVPLARDLSREALFLEPGPVGSQARRRWLQQQVGKLPDERLNGYWLAFYDLLKDK